jgi:hypothetical protein
MTCGDTTPIDFIFPGPLGKGAAGAFFTKIKSPIAGSLSGSIQDLHQARFSRIYAGRTHAPAS